MFRSYNNKERLMKKKWEPLENKWKISNKLKKSITEIKKLFYKDYKDIKKRFLSKLNKEKMNGKGNWESL